MKPNCDVCINEKKYLDKKGNLTVYHVNGTKQHPETWANTLRMVAEANEIKDYIPRKI